MSENLRRYRPLTWGMLCAFGLLAGCGDGLTLPPATVPIAQQQITLFALTSTPVGTPSAYNMISLAEVQVFRTNDFDFVFDIGVDSTYGVGTKGDTVAVFIPRAYLGFSEDGGLQFSATTFDSLTIAPLTGYEKQKPTKIRVGDTFVAASRIQTCNFSFVRPRYAKIYIQSIDLVARSVTAAVIIDTNCGYRSLTSGIPTI
jgi:hypothetical protein